MSGKLIPVRVAVRCRPLVPREEREGCTSCVSFVPGEPQLLLGSNKAFTYDYVFGPMRPQRDVYEESVRDLVDSLFKGYNATVLAYGQTGSGKTYSMGGGYDLEDTANNELRGVIPRVIHDLYEGFRDKSDMIFTTKVSYIELYKEDLIDLLVPPSKREKDAIQVREDVNGGIRIVGMKEVEVADEEEMMKCLEEGASGRTTGSTAMNASSSRSHAIFTIHVEKTSKHDSRDFVKTKFHLVDLAGSERQKKTKAEGERLKEGININKGLLALGNVISALGEQTSQRPHIPYRDSKLTRILQDSLGGNSHTLMIACISPADSNMEETMSTLRYADRARKIKNKPVINRDPQAAEIMRLRQLVQQLQEDIKKGGGGKSLNSSSASTTENESVDELLDKIKKLQDENTLLSLKLRMVVDQNADLHQKLLQTEESRDKLKETLDEIKDKNSLHISMLQRSTQCDKDGEPPLSVTVEDQQKILEEIQTTINELESEIHPPEEIEDEETHGDSSIFYEEQRAQTMKQVKNMEELGELERQIKSKEIVIKQIMEGDVLMKQYEDERKKFEDEISKLQKERTDLMEKVHEAKSNPAASKISEQRRKRLQEVEAELGKVKRKLNEQAKMLKIKEQDEKRYQKINSEIRDLKQARVRMIKQIKEDAKSFTKWKQAKEKELLQLKAKDRRQQIQMVKIKQQSERQQAVLKRKAQEAEAANKRLKEAMAKQRNVMAERMNKLDKTKQPFKESVKKWLVGDLELAVSLEEARHHMNELIQDRKDLSEEVSALREKLGTPTFKKKKLNNHSSIETCDHEIIAKDMKEAERQLELRNAQIADIQQKLMDADSDEKTKTRFHGIHTLGEAKVVMNQLFSSAVESKLEQLLKKNEVAAANQQVADSQKAVEDAEEDAQKKVNDLHGEIDSLTKHYNKKILALLSELNSQTPRSPGGVDAALKGRLQFQEKEIDRLSNLAEELDKKSAECQDLQKELTVMKYSVKTGKMVPHFASTSFFTPPQIPKRRSLKRKSSPQMEDPVTSDDDYEENIENNNQDESTDPDWKSGFTPNPNKMMKKKASVSHGVTDNLKKAAKLSDPRSPCNCKGTCNTRRCRCVSSSSQCSEYCKCSSQKCQNQEAQFPESTTGEPNEDTESQTSSMGANTTFVLDSSEATVSNSTFTTEPASSKDKKNPSVLALRSVFSDDNVDLDSSEDFDKPKESKKNRTLERSGILSYQKKLAPKKGTFFGKL